MLGHLCLQPVADKYTAVHVRERPRLLYVVVGDSSRDIAVPYGRLEALRAAYLLLDHGLYDGRRRQGRFARSSDGLELGRCQLAASLQGLH